MMHGSMGNWPSRGHLTPRPLLRPIGSERPTRTHHGGRRHSDPARWRAGVARGTARPHPGVDAVRGARIRWSPNGTEASSPGLPGTLRAAPYLEPRAATSAGVGPHPPPPRGPFHGPPVPPGRGHEVGGDVRAAMDMAWRPTRSSRTPFGTVEGSSRCEGGRRMDGSCANLTTTVRDRGSVGRLPASRGRH